MKWQEVKKVLKIIGKSLYMIFLFPIVFIFKYVLKDGLAMFEDMKNLKYVLISILFIAPIFIIVELINYLRGI
jgi:hypothetical protein